MRNKIANFLSFFRKLNKRTFGILLFFISLGLFLPLYSGQAAFLGLAARIADAIISLVFVNFILISVGILKVSTGILNWIISGGFTTFSYTHNPFVNPAWAMVRDLANMFFIIILIVVGLATSLRLREYEVKKILPLFIIIALLINFTPVITGLIVDASNIIMNTFLQATGDFSSMAFIFGDVLLDLTGNPVEHVLEIVVVMMFNLVTSVIFLLYALLFAFRYVAIWTLVILSPIAFAAYILPATRKVFSQWWNEFLQWCFVGTTASFFLYLGQMALSVIAKPENSPSSVDIPGGTPIISSIVDSILPYGISMVLLILGFYASLSIGAMGANQIISGAKKGGRFAGSFAASQTLGRLLATKKGAGMMKSLSEKKFALPETYAEWRKGGKLKMARDALLAPIAYPARYAVRRAAKGGLAYGAAQEQTIQNELKGIEQEFGTDYERAASSASAIPIFNWQKSIAMGRYLAQQKGAKALSKLPEEQRNEIIRKTATYTPDKLKDVVKHMPELIDGEDVDETIKETIQKAMVPDGLEDKDAKKMLKLGYKEDEAVIAAAHYKAVEALSTKDIETLGDKAIDNPYTQDMIIRFKPKSFLKKLGEEKLEHSEKIYSRMKELGAEEIAKTNSKFLRDCVLDGGMKVFYPELKGAETLEEIDELKPRTTEQMSKKLAAEKEIESQLKSELKTLEREVKYPPGGEIDTKTEQNIKEARTKLKETGGRIKEITQKMESYETQEQRTETKEERKAPERSERLKGFIKKTEEKNRKAAERMEKMREKYGKLKTKEREKQTVEKVKIKVKREPTVEKSGGGPTIKTTRTIKTKRGSAPKTTTTPKKPKVEKTKISISPEERKEIIRKLKGLEEGSTSIKNLEESYEKNLKRLEELKKKLEDLKMTHDEEYEFDKLRTQKLKSGGFVYGRLDTQKDLIERGKKEIKELRKKLEK